MEFIGIYTTNRCNLKCKYCFAEKNFLDINPKEVCEFVKYYVKNNNEKKHMVLFTGGEPLLHKELKTMILNLKNSVEKIIVLTNGVLINEDWIKFFKENNIYLHISLDSITPEYHNTYRGEYYNIKKNLEKIEKNNIPITICMTMSRKNIVEVIEMIHYTKERNFNLDLNLISLNSTDELSWENASKEEIQQAIIAIEKWANITGRIVKGKLMVSILKKSNLKIPFCYNEKHTVIICTDGNVYPCFFNKKNLYGNIYRDLFQNILDKKSLECKKILDCFGMECLGIYD